MGQLPTGTVTFLYTDIEGSTTRWERQPQAMKAAVARRDALLRQAVAITGGQVVRSAGDRRYAAFPAAASSLTGAVGPG